MGKHPRCAWVLGVSLLVTMSARSGQKGYLAAGLLTPLRFQLPRVILVPAPAVLSLLQSTPRNSESSVTNVTPPLTTPSTNAPATPITASSPEPRSMVPLPGPMLPEPNAPLPINSQTVMGYLEPGSTNAPAANLPPPAFVPPLWMPPPGTDHSSHAVYESH